MTRIKVDSMDADEIDGTLDLHDPKIKAQIRQSNKDIRAGRTRLAEYHPADSRDDRQNKDPKQAFRELAQVVAEIRQEAKEKGIDKMPMSEINAAVTAVRRDQKKTNKRPAK